jgi:hypothetical protein
MMKHVNTLIRVITSSRSARFLTTLSSFFPLNMTVYGATNWDQLFQHTLGGTRINSNMTWVGGGGGVTLVKHYDV